MIALCEIIVNLRHRFNLTTNLNKNHENMAVIGIDLGGTKVAAAVFDSVGNILAKEVKLLNGAQGEEVG